MRGHARSGASRIPRPVKIPSGVPVSTCISPAQNVLFWFSIGHFSYGKIADHSGGFARLPPAGITLCDPPPMVGARTPAPLLWPDGR